MTGRLAAVDATKETALATEFGVKGFPSLKYFANGEFVFEVPNVRDRAKLVEFMVDPQVGGGGGVGETGGGVGWERPVGGGGVGGADWWSYW